MTKYIVTCGLLAVVVLPAKTLSPRLSAQPTRISAPLVTQSVRKESRPVVAPTLYRRLQPIDSRQSVTEDEHEHGHSHDSIGVRQAIQSIGRTIFSLF